MAPGPNQMLVCSKCRKKRPGAEFAVDSTRPTGRTSYCSKCYRAKKKIEHRRHPGANNKHSERHRLNNPETYRARALLNRAHYPKAAYARGVIRNEVKRGRLKREPCETCGRAYAHAHHDDYDKPLEVRWLCPTHHRYWHEEHGQGANIEGEPEFVANHRLRSA